VPPNTSPGEYLAFKNTGTTQLTLSISVSGGPLAISESRCGNGVKPSTHCYLYLTYTPQTIGEADNGMVTINCGEGVVTVPLSGQGVAAMPTWAHLGPAPMQCLKIHLGDSFSMSGAVGIADKYYAPPTGEQVYFRCTNGQETVDLGAAPLGLCTKHCPSIQGYKMPYDVTSAFHHSGPNGKLGVLYDV